MVHPGMSSDIISTSAASMVMSCDSTTSGSVPSFSKREISSCERAMTALFTLFISFPNFFPIVRKLHFTFFTSTPALLSINSISLTFVSESITLAICSMRWRISLSVAGIDIFCSACITGIFTFLRSERTIDVTCIATFIAISSSGSIYGQLPFSSISTFG